MSDTSERAAHAVGNVQLAFAKGQLTGDVGRWVIFDHNREGDAQWAFIGPECDPLSDRLEAPPELVATLHFPYPNQNPGCSRFKGMRRSTNPG